MTNRDFAYWLQGAFEIFPESELGKFQIELIKKHAKLILETENTNINPILVKVIDLLATEKPNKLRAEILLSEMFVHVIDPSFGNLNNKLNDIHGGNMRC